MQSKFCKNNPQFKYSESRISLGRSGCLPHIVFRSISFNKEVFVNKIKLYYDSKLNLVDSGLKCPHC